VSATHEEIDFEGARGLRLRVCKWGQPTPGRLPVVVLHGYLEQGFAWDAVANELTGEIYAPDQRGHGLSGHVGAGGFYHFWDYVGDLDALTKQLGGQIDLVGHSMGGTVACLYAGTRPEAVRKLVLIEGLGPPNFVPLALARSRQFLNHLQTPPVNKPLASIQAAAARMTRHNPRLDPELALRLADRITTAQPDGTVLWTWDALHRATSPVPFDPAAFVTWLASIEAPTLYIDGGESRFQIPDTNDRLRHIRGAQRLQIAAAGHLVHHDAPKPLATAIDMWLGATA
jgi:pimeloyl-ACP methyl ester carboxylesterase